MSFDFVTFGAQLVNFLVLVWFLKRFLFGPITKVMKRREEGIADRLEEAEASRRQAEKQEGRFLTLEGELAERREQILAEARVLAAEQGAEILSARRLEADRAEASWREGLRREKASFLAELRQRTAEEVLSLCERVLGDLASQDLESRIGDLIVGWLEDLDSGARDRFQAAVDGAGGRVEVLSSLRIAESVRSKIRRSLESAAKVSSVTWRESPDLGFGIEVRAGGWQLGWSLESYLDVLRDRVGEWLGEAASESGLSRLATPGFSDSAGEASG